MVQIQPRKHVLLIEHADFPDPTRQHKLYQDRSGLYLSALKDLDRLLVYPPWRVLVAVGLGTKDGIKPLFLKKLVRDMRRFSRGR